MYQLVALRAVVLRLLVKAGAAWPQGNDPLPADLEVINPDLTPSAIPPENPSPLQRGGCTDNRDTRDDNRGTQETGAPEKRYGLRRPRGRNAGFQDSILGPGLSFPGVPDYLHQTFGRKLAALLRAPAGAAAL